MSIEYHPHSDLINAIGSAALSTQFALTPQGLYAWRIRGIPYTHRGAVAQLAVLNNVAVPGDFFVPPARSKKKPARAQVAA